MPDRHTEGFRAPGPFRQALLILGWFRDRACVYCLARDTGISQATGYRYLHEGIDVLAGQAPNLRDVLDRCRREGVTYVVLEGTLIPHRLARDYETHPHRSEAMIRLAMIDLMSRRLIRESTPNWKDS